MRCPQCDAPVQLNQKMCENCGASLPDFDSDLVFSERELPAPKKNPAKKALIIVLCALLVVGVLFLYLRYKRDKENSAKGTATASEAVSTVPSEAATQLTAATETQPISATETQPPATTAAPASTAATEALSSQQKIEAYVNASNFREALIASAGTGTNVYFTSAELEDTVIYAYYQYDDSAQESSQTDQLPSFNGDEICSRLAETVSDMKQKTGVADAQIEVEVVDTKGTVIYTGYAD